MRKSFKKQGENGKDKQWLNQVFFFFCPKELNYLNKMVEEYYSR